MTQKLYCFKIGGSVITNKAIAYTAKKKTIKAIAQSLREIKSPIVISHGVGSFAHPSAAKYIRKNGYTSRWGLAKVARDAQEINRIFIDAFIEVGLPVISFSPRSSLLTEKAETDTFFFDPILEALHQGLIPVIHGDGIFDTKQKIAIYSGETSLNLLVRYLLKHDFTIEKIIQLCNVDGVLDENNKAIPEITQSNWETVKRYIKKMEVIDFSGGMKHKVEEALLMTKYGIETVIINGNKVDSLTNFIKGKQLKGTIIRK